MKRVPQILLIIALLLPAAGFAPGAASAWHSLSLQAALAAPGEPDSPAPTRVFFLPFVGQSIYSITGQVLDSNRNPLAGVMVADQSGNMSVTDRQGRYVFPGLKAGEYAVAPAASQLYFSPSMIDVNVPNWSGDQNFTAVTSATAATEAVKNGGFEIQYADPGSNPWHLLQAQSNPVAEITDDGAHSGTYSLRTGIFNATDTDGMSAAQQNVIIPITATSAVLSVWIYPYSEEAAAQQTYQLAANAPNAPAFTDAPDTPDAQFIEVWSETDNDGDETLLKTLMYTLSDDQEWSRHTFNLLQYRNSRIKIRIGTYNDGPYGYGRTAMYVDDVSLQIEGSGTGGPNPTATPTVIPGSCSDRIDNGDFETNQEWDIPITEFTAGYSTAQAHGGARSLRTGILKSGQNRYSYSSASQTLKIPSSADSATLGMWIYQSSDEADTASSSAVVAEPQVGVRVDQQVMDGDVQQILILDEWGNILKVLYSKTKDTQEWIHKEFDLDSYIGDTIRIYVGTYNDGWDGITSMFVDDVSLVTCPEGATATATPTTTTTSTSPTATSTSPTATAIPAACEQVIDNDTFEESNSWEIPVTAFSAGYSEAEAHAGERSMRTGILHASHNRYSYSDAYQEVKIPNDADTATLYFYAFQSSTEDTSLQLAPAVPTGDWFTNLTAASDVQYVLILDEWGNWIDTLLWDLDDDDEWVQYDYDLSHYIGDTIRIQFGTYNDGWDGYSSMFVDDMSLLACP